MALSFGVVAVLGGFLLTLPASLRHTADASFVDSLFMSTSAVCVTGLAVGDVASTYTVFGQAVLLVLIQVGGLGIMVMSSFFAIVAGRRLRARSSAVLAEMIDAESFTALRRNIRSIVLYTLVLEALGAAVLWFSTRSTHAVALGPESPDPAAGAGSGVWWAVFHSVSAFCNAGFSLSHGNFTAFVGSWPVGLTVCVLVTLGGIGFPVLEEVVSRVRDRLAGRRPDRLSLQLRVVLLFSALLTIGGAVVFVALEWDRSLRALPPGDGMLAALFHSVSARTAGFNSVDVASFGAPALLFVAFLMFVGASPGSTGGGIKTTTFAALLATFRAELRGETEPRILDRRISVQTVRRAAGVAVVSIVFVTVVVFVLFLTEGADESGRKGPLPLLFEAVSAFATCGLSASVTPNLTDAGKLVVVLTMFVGRIGPLTLALAVAAAQQRARFTVPEGRLNIG
jgi:trk system potassium uptake protein TrkH